MIKPFYQYLVLFLLVIIQITIFNNIHILGWSPPFIMIYPILFAPLHNGRNESLLTAFLVGLLVDVFTNSLGINSFAFLTIAFLRGFILSPHKVHEVSATMRPSIKLMGVSRFLSFVFIMVFIYSALVYLLELSSFANIGIVLLKILVSTLATFVLFTVFQLFNMKR